MKTLFLIFFPLILFAEGVFETDFTGSTFPKELLFSGRNAGYIKDGVLTLGKKGKNFSALHIHKSVESPFELSFRIRRTFVSEGAQNWGVIFQRTDGIDVKIYNAFGFNISRNKKTLLNNHFEEKIDFPAGEKAAFAEVRIRVTQDFVILSVNGKILGSKPLKSVPVKQITFYTFNNEIQLDILKLEQIAIPKGKNIEAPVFSIDFEDGLNARNADGKIIPAAIQPSRTAPLEDGVSGKALCLKQPNNRNPEVTWEIGDCLGKDGAIMFWARLEEDFSKEHFQFNGWTPFFSLYDKKGTELIRFSTSSHNNSVILHVNGGRKTLNRFARNVMFSGDWNHFAFTWSDGVCTWFINGLPYFPGNTWQANTITIPDYDLKDARFLKIGKKTKASLDRIQLFHKKMKPEEIYLEYRKYSPVDLVLPDAKLSPSPYGREILLIASPGGEFIRPIPGEVEKTPAVVTFKIDFIDLNRKELFRKKIVQTIDSRKEIRLFTGPLPVGKYFLRCSMEDSKGNRSHRSFQLECLETASAEPESSEDLQLDQCIFSKEFTDIHDKSLVIQGKPVVIRKTYMEPGNRKGDRFGVEVSFPKETLQKPLVIEITWPDDKPRMAGLYMYLYKPQGQCYRDRLQGGYQAGNEYPNTGKMISTRYVFWPQTKSCLFEIRTLANDYPAAIRSLKIFTLKNGKLPCLKLNRPEGYEPRRIGHTDEDQTLTTNMSGKSYLSVLNRILEYMDYTGQEIFYYPIIRYGFTFFPLPHSNGNELWPTDPGSIGHMIRTFNNRGKKFVGILNMSTLPEITYAELCGTDANAKGWLNLNKDFYNTPGGLSSVRYPNPCHPDVVKMYLRYVEDFFLCGQQPDFEALDLWSYPSWSSLETGYDNFTVEKFSRETGLQIPSSKRYEFLTSKQIRSRWIEWRARQIANLITKVRKLVNKYNPKVKLFVEKRHENPEDPYLETMLRKIPRVYYTHFRRPTAYRHNFHWGRPESNLDEKMYDYNAIRAETERKSNENVTIFYTYYETFTPSMMKKYGCYFQNADPKPEGRYFLKELAFNVAAADALRIGFGGQPFGSFGRDWQTREFAKAFSALPALSFNTIPNRNSSVTVRSLNTRNGTYFYAVSLVWQDTMVNLQPDLECVDLSTGETIRTSNILLKPFQLRSFLIPNREIAFHSYRILFPDSLRNFYKQKILVLEKTISALEKYGLPLSEEKKRLENIQHLMQQEDYAEVHRLCFSPLMNQLPIKKKNLNLLVQEQNMIRRNHYAVNCGDTKPLITKTGKLFFGDRPFSQGASFGYFGKYESTVRKIDQMPESDIRELFLTEAYDIDGWKFKLANGTYRLRLYMKIGYPHDFAKDKVVFSVLAQGKVLFADKDFYVEKKDFNTPVILDFKNIKVTDGLLTLEFKQKHGLGGNIRLCNGIEIFPETKTPSR